MKNQLSGLNTIWSLFDASRILKVPNYQRAYSWGKKNIEDFLDDLQNYSNQEVNKQYFIGTFLLQSTEKNGNFEQFFVVDGQQRLTTTVIYLKVLLEHLQNIDSENLDQEVEAFLFKYKNAKFQTIDADNSFFIDYILKDNSPTTYETESQNKLYCAKKWFQDFVQSTDKDTLKAHLDIIKNTLSLVYVVENSAEATLIFETTNDRGKKLTNLESLKSFLMHKIYIATDEPLGVISEIEGHFETIYREQEKIEQHTNEDDVLRYFFIAEWPWKSKKEYQNVKDEIKKTFNKLIKQGEKEKCITLIQEKVRTLKEYFEKMRILVNNEILSSHLDDLQALNRTATFFPLLLKSYSSLPENSAQYSKVIQLCEIFAFKGYGLANKRSDTGLSWFYECARDFKGDYTELLDWLIEAIEDWNVPKLFRESFDSTSFYYQRSDARYLLWKYENSLRKEAGYTLLSHNDYSNRKTKNAFSIEHIAAQKGKEVKECLLSVEVDNEFKENYLHHLGNLAIDPLSSNIKKSNLSFDEKQYKFFSKAPLMSHAELEEIAQEFGAWDFRAIEKRATKIKEFALDYWDETKVHKISDS